MGRVDVLRKCLGMKMFEEDDDNVLTAGRGRLYTQVLPMPVCW